jgi:radical SAM/Cys-rich protein
MVSVELPILDQAHFEQTVKGCFDHALQASQSPTTLQINIGAVCNLACRHCHVESSPSRTGEDENMTLETAQRVVEWTTNQPWLQIVDLTGGSPEMNPNFRWMVERFRALGLQVIDRCNPTIIGWKNPRSGETFDWIPAFLADHCVQVVASMPCYEASNVNKQRGRGAFDASIEGLRALCAVGYGRDPDLVLNLVFNPVGPVLPPSQAELQPIYRQKLRDQVDIEFNELWTIANMPIKRWRHQLERAGELEQYMQLLIDAFNPETIEALMCRHLVNIDSQGRVFDCDFNQALDIPSLFPAGKKIWDLSFEDIRERTIATADHCYGCTAGCGSSCSGSLL